MEVIPGPLADEAYQLGGMAEDSRALHIAWQVTSQRDDTTYPGILVPVEKLTDALARALDARHVWGRLDAGLGHRLVHGLDSARAGRAAGAEGHRKERWSQRCERPESHSEVFLSCGRLGWEQLDAEDFGVFALALHELPSPPNRTDRLRQVPALLAEAQQRPQYVHPRSVCLPSVALVLQHIRLLI